MSGESPFGDLLHALRADLHLYPYSVGTHNSRVQRFVTVGLGHRNPVAQAIRFRRIDVGDSREYLPAQCLFRGERQRLEDDPDGEQVVNLLEGNLFALHLAPDRVKAFDTSRNFEVDMVPLERFDDRGVEFADEGFALFFGRFEFFRQLGILYREAIFHAEVFEFALDGVQAEPIRQRCEQVKRFTRDFDLLVGRHRPQRTHVVQAVGDFDQDHPHVVRKREQDFAEILRLLRSIGIEYARHLRKPIDHLGDLGPEDALHIFDRVLRILHNVVQQGGDDRFDAEPDLVHDDLGYGDGMQQVRLARATTHSAMRLFRQEKSAFDELPVFVVFTDFGARLKQFLPLLLD